MKHVDVSVLAPEECIGIQINGLNHCTDINCKWQGLSACQGQNIIRTGRNSKGIEIGPYGLATITNENTNSKNKNNENCSTCHY